MIRHLFLSFFLSLSLHTYASTNDNILGVFSSNVALNNFGKLESNYFITGLFGFGKDFYYNGAKLADKPKSPNDFDGFVAIISKDGELLKYCVLRGKGTEQPSAIYSLGSTYVIISSATSDFNLNSNIINVKSEDASLVIIELDANLELLKYKVLHGKSGVYYSSSANIFGNLYLSYSNSGKDEVIYDNDTLSSQSGLLEINNTNWNLKSVIYHTKNVAIDFSLNSNEYLSFVSASSRIDTTFSFADKKVFLKKGEAKMFVLNNVAYIDSFALNFDVGQNFIMRPEDYFVQNNRAYLSGYYEGKGKVDEVDFISQGYDGFVFVKEGNQNYFCSINNGSRDWPVKIDKNTSGVQFVFNCKGDVEIGNSKVQNPVFSPLWFSLNDDLTFKSANFKIEPLDQTSQIVNSGDIIIDGTKSLIAIQTNGSFNFNKLKATADDGFAIFIFSSDLTNSIRFENTISRDFAYYWQGKSLVICALLKDEVVQVLDLSGRQIASQKADISGRIVFNDLALNKANTFVINVFNNQTGKFVNTKKVIKLN